MPLNYQDIMRNGRTTFDIIEPHIKDYIDDFMYLRYLKDEGNIPNWLERCELDDPICIDECSEDELELCDEIIQNTINSQVYKQDTYNHFNIDMPIHNAHGHILSFILFCNRESFGDDYMVFDSVLFDIRMAYIHYTYAWLLIHKDYIIRRLKEKHREVLEEDEVSN